MLPDKDARSSIMSDSNSILVSASAGSGKTTIMVKKIKDVLDFVETHKTIAAVTFTIKAAKEIKEKALTGGISTPFVTNTNDSFIEHEIIRPFISDALGKEYKSDYIVDFNADYKFNNYTEGLSQLESQNVLGTYWDNDLNFNFEIALRILKHSRAAREYLKSKYEMIFIDEYQDSDMDMHNLFMYFYNELNIKLFIVGDEKQAIYLWRGAEKEIFSLIPDSFSKYKLIKNFRCNDEIINYANLIHEPDIFNKDIVKPVNHLVHIGSTNLVENFSQLVELNYIDLNKSITIIANINNDAKEYSKKLQASGYDFIFIPRTPLDQASPNSYLLKQIAMFLKDNNYNSYDLIEQTNLDEENINMRELKVMLNKLVKEVETTKEVNKLKICCDYLKIRITKNEEGAFYETMRDSQYDIAFQERNDLYQVMTVFSSKGLEFDQVISFSGYYAIHRKEGLQNHYVSITRAKERFIMIIENTAYENYIDKVAEESGIEDSSLMYKQL